MGRGPFRTPLLASLLLAAGCPCLAFRTEHHRLARELLESQQVEQRRTSREDIIDRRRRARLLIDNSSVETEVRSCASQLRDGADMLDAFVETQGRRDEAAQEAAAARAVTHQSVLAWAAEKLANTTRAVRRAVASVGKIMQSWLVALLDRVANGDLDDVVEVVKETMTSGMYGLRVFIKKLWAMFSMLIEKMEVKAYMEDISGRVHRAVAPFFGSDGALPEGDATDDEADNATLASFLQLALPDGQERFEPSIFGPRAIKQIVPNKFRSLLMCITIDMLGMMSYAENAAFFLGEVLDLAWAPVAGMAMRDLFDGSNTIMKVGFLEEALPFTDFVPTASIGWLFAYNGFLGCATFRSILSLPDRTSLGFSCPDSTLKDIKDKGYVVVKDNAAGHLYLACNSDPHGARQKASCIEWECKAVGGWCWVENRCGDRSWWVGKCEELEGQNLLSCPA